MQTVWICDKCGCEVKGDDKPSECPLCIRKETEFLKMERKDPDREEIESLKKYEEVIDELEKYTEDCEPEQAKYSLED